MKYSSKDNLELYWKDKNNAQNNFIKINDTNGSLFTFSTTISINVISNVSNYINLYWFYTCYEIKGHSFRVM